MKTPNIPAAALALALAGAAPALAQSDPAPSPSSDTAPKQVLPKNFVGPPDRNQCIAGTPGCGSEADGMAATEQGLLDIGKLQQKEAQQKADAERQRMMAEVKKDEDGMLKGGIYKEIDRTADGKGAIITLPDGSVMWSDYVQGFDSMPQKTPQDLLALLKKNPNVDPAILGDVEKAIAKQDAKNNPDQKQLDEANKRMFADAAGGQPSAPAPKGSGGSMPSDVGAAGPGATAPSRSGSGGPAQADPNAYAFSQGSSLGQSGLFGSGAGAAGEVGRGSPDQALTAAAPTVTPGHGVEALDPSGYEFTGVRRAAARAQAVLGRTLDAQRGSDGGGDEDAGLKPDQAGRGFNASENR